MDRCVWLFKIILERLGAMIVSLTLLLRQNFSQQPRLPSLNVNIPPTPGAYSPAALSAVISGAPNNVTARTVYIGNLPATASVDELLNLVHFGPLESIRVLPEKSCVFLSFLDGQTAASFHADATIKKLSLHGQELKIGWGKPSPVPAQVQLAIQQSNASRNVYLGGLDEGMTEEMLRDELSRFGLIDQVKIVRDKNIGFVHFLSISVATKVCAAYMRDFLISLTNGSFLFLRWSIRCLRNQRGQVSASTTARIDAPTSPNHSKPLLRLPRLLLRSPSSIRQPSRLTLLCSMERRTHLVVHSPRTPHFHLMAWAWLLAQECKDLIERCTWGTFTQRRPRRTCVTLSGEVYCKACGTCKTSISRWVFFLLSTSEARDF